VEIVYNTTGKMVEKYDVVQSSPGGGGEYPLADGFGWTNGVTIGLLEWMEEYTKEKTTE
jgi:alpha,alpha-trehalase